MTHDFKDSKIIVIDAETGERVNAEIDGQPTMRKPGLLGWLGIGGGVIVIGALFLTFFAVALVIMIPLGLWGAWKLRRSPAFRAMQERMKQAQHQGGGDGR